MIRTLVLALTLAAPVTLLGQALCKCVPSTGGLPATFFGQTQTQTGGAQNPTVIAAVMRLYDTNVGGSPACVWPGIETSAGVYSFTNCDTFTDLAFANGQKWDFVWGRTPSFDITTPGACVGNFKPGSCGQKTSDLNTTNTILTNVVTAVVNHWKSRYPTATGNYMECVNEFDLVSNWANDAGTTNGTMADLVKYCTTVKTVAQSIDPTIIVLGPATSTYNQFGVHGYGPAAGNTPTAGNGYLQASGALASMDAINLHPYSYCNTSPPSCPSTSTLQAALNAAKTVFDSYGITKPIIDTEDSWGTDIANNTMTDTDREAWDATFAIKVWNQGHAGAWRYQWTCPSGVLTNCYGTRSGSGVGTGVATALSTLQTWMIGAQHAVGTCNQNADGHGTWRCLYTSSGLPNYFIFNDSGNQTFSVAGLGVMTQFNLDGTNSAIVANSVTAGKLPIRVQ